MRRRLGGLNSARLLLWSFDFAEIEALQAEGESLPHLLWQLGEDIRALAAVIEATAGGAPLATAVRTVRVWGKRQEALGRAARRVAPRAIAPLLRALANLDALSKGIGTGNAWDELRRLALALAGRDITHALAA